MLLRTALVAVSICSLCFFGCSSSRNCGPPSPTVVPPIYPSISVKDAVNGAPICDATVLAVSGVPGMTPGSPTDGPAIQEAATGPMPAILTSDANADGFTQLNVLSPASGCTYSVAYVMENAGAYVIYVSRPGYVAQEVSNVLTLSGTDRCGVEITPPPKPQTVNVSLPPAGT